MIKRIVCLVLTLILSLSCCAALADDPQPIETIPMRSCPRPLTASIITCCCAWTNGPANP